MQVLNRHDWWLTYSFDNLVEKTFVASEQAYLRKEDKVIVGDEIIGENRLKARPRRTLRLSTVSTEDNWKITKSCEKRCMQQV